MPDRMAMFYTYHQNNSGGNFDRDDRVAETVIIEANSPDDGNYLAECVGIYFNGVEAGHDCSCCGDRWHSVWQEGTEVPEIYAKDPAKHVPYCTDADQPYCYVYYLDGRVESYRLRDRQPRIKKIFGDKS